LLPVVRYDEKAHERSLDVMRWGLVPFWAKDIKVGGALRNSVSALLTKSPACSPRLPRRPHEVVQSVHDASLHVEGLSDDPCGRPGIAAVLDRV
jgi:putative SOS response-associated peptidase YedK